MKHGVSLTTSYGQTTRYTLTLWRQPWHRYLAATLYHRYDSIVWRVPGVRSVEHWLRDRSTDPDYIPFTNRQDIRCHDLHRKQREELTSMQITEDSYKRLKKALYGTSSW